MILVLWSTDCSLQQALLPLADRNISECFLAVTDETSSVTPFLSHYIICHAGKLNNYSAGAYEDIPVETNDGA